MAEPAKPVTESDMAEIEKGTAAVCLYKTFSACRSDRESGACVKGLSSARVSTFEEPGAG